MANKITSSISSVLEIRNQNIKTAKLTNIECLRSAFILNELNYNTKEVPASKIKYFKDNNGYYQIVKYNPFKCESNIKLKDIYYVKINVKKELLEQISLSRYSYKGKNIKVTNAIYNNGLYETVGLLIPIEIFKIMMNDLNTPIQEKPRLSYIIFDCSYPLDIKLLDSNKKCVGFATSFNE